MNRAPLIFLGVFLALAFSWTGIVLVNQISYGSLTPVYDPVEGKTFPEVIPGVAMRGQLVYQDLGCVYCHTHNRTRTRIRTRNQFACSFPKAEAFWPQRMMKPSCSPK